MRDFIFWICIVVLFGVAAFEGGYIVAKLEKFDHDGRLVQHETQIQVLKSDVRVIKEKVRIP